jgi:hypothetical protein
VILYQCFAWNAQAVPADRDGPLWCLYLSERPISCTVEQLARFRGQRLTAALLRRRGLPLALAELELPAEAQLVDLRLRTYRSCLPAAQECPG